MTCRRTYDLGDLEASLFGQILDTLNFCAPGGARVVERGRAVVAVEGDDDAALESVDAFVREMRATRAKLRRKVLADHRVAETYGGDIDADLAASGDVYALGEGLVGIRGSVLRLVQFFEHTFARLAESYGAEENRYPALLPIEVLEEIGYFEHFPQQVTFCSHLPEDLGLLEALAGDVKAAGGVLPPGQRTRVCPPAHVLAPAVCLPCYPQHRDRVVDAEASRVVSMQNHVHRYEGRNCRSLARLWDFTVRDVVFFGGYEALQRRREEVMAWSMALCQELGLDARLQLANDPFFLSEARDKRVYQRMGEVKYELVLALPHRDEELAVSSFNLHRDFYSRVYGIHLPDGRHAESACMGFGLERWAYAFLAQKGLDRSRWPARVVAWVDGNGG
jgi:seryl-tRNA synthetase